VTHDIRDQLRDADPLTHEPALSADEAHAMRRTVVSAACGARHQRVWVGVQIAGAIAIACTVVMILMVATSRRLDRGAVGPATAPDRDAPRQLQFETPGGTRIIWVLNPALEL
jgi:hypothetical protein